MEKENKRERHREMKMTKRTVWLGIIVYAIVFMAAFVTMLIMILR